MGPDEIEDINRAAELHDAEWEVMRSHTMIGERMLNAAPALRPIAELRRCAGTQFDPRVVEAVVAALDAARAEPVR